MLGPPQALCGMGATIIQEQDVQAVGEGLGEGVDERLKHIGIQIRELKEEALTCGWGHSAVDIESFEGVLDHPNGLDPRGREAPSAHRY